MRWIGYLKSGRLWGLLSVGVGFYILIVYVLGPRNVDWLINNGPYRFHWPDIPYFYSHERVAPDGQHQEQLFVVPTRQLSSNEVYEAEHPDQQPAPAPAPKK